MSNANYDIKKAKIQMRKGVLEFPVLLIIGTKEVYASEILKKLKENNLIVAEGTLYPLLSRIKRQGLIQHKWEESNHGPPRKYYTLTETGQKVLEEMQESWLEFTSSIQSLITTHEIS